MHARRLLLLFCLLGCFALGWLPLAAHASETRAEHAANVYAAQEVASHPLHANLPDYALPADKLLKAQRLARIETTLHFLGEFWQVALLVLLLVSGAVGRMQARAQRLHNRWAQGFTFVLLLLLFVETLELPLQLYGHHLGLLYGFSIQGWGSWFADKGKLFLTEWSVGGLLTMLLFLLIRKLPGTWWLAFAAIWSVVLLLGFYGGPAYTQLFYKYEPLEARDPALVQQLERIVAKGGMDIPPSRMFVMKASAKVTTLNADVEGFGSSKRVVVWDTTLAKAKPDEIAFIFGHESGHYVLGHLTQGLLLGILGSFAGFYIAFVAVRFCLRRFGPAWHIHHQQDWGTLAVLLLVFAVLSVGTEPLANAFIRSNEHAADVYGQEAVHGIVPDPQASAQHAFDLLGETSLDDPNPSPLYEFWTYTHPAIGRRAAFAHAYNPWVPGAEPKYFGK